MNNDSFFAENERVLLGRERVRLPSEWQDCLFDSGRALHWYQELDGFLDQFAHELCPQKQLIFNAFNRLTPNTVRVVLLGEEPYPRVESSCGVAFWDREISSWQQKGRGNCLHNIFKALVIARGWSQYGQSLDEMRAAYAHLIMSPNQLFASWMERGVLLLNAALTFSSIREKSQHHAFWQPFLHRVLRRLSAQYDPWFVVWGKKALRRVQQAGISEERLIVAGHPTYFHQFCDADDPSFSPFVEIERKTGFRWS